MRTSLPWKLSSSTKLNVSPVILPSFNSASRFWSPTSDAGLAGQLFAVGLKGEQVLLHADLGVELRAPLAGDVRRVAGGRQEPDHTAEEDHADVFHKCLSLIVMLIVHAHQIPGYCPFQRYVSPLASLTSRVTEP